MNRADIAALAHTLAVQLVLFGAINRTDVASAEGSISTAITAACALISQAMILWKYLHHQQKG